MFPLTGAEPFTPRYDLYRFAIRYVFPKLRGLLQGSSGRYGHGREEFESAVKTRLPRNPVIFVDILPFVIFFLQECTHTITAKTSVKLLTV